MKKNLLIRLLTLILTAVLLLTGCGTSTLEELFSRNGSAEIKSNGVKFSDMVYVRPDADTIKALMKEACNAAEAGDDGQFKELLGQISSMLDDYYCMYTLADIHNSLNVTDEYWSEEYFYVASIEAGLLSGANELSAAVENCSIRRRIQRQDYWQNFEAAYVSDYEYSDGIVELMERENELLAEYRDLTAAPVITLNGTEYDYYEYLADCDYDEQYDAVMEYYHEYNERAGEIYIELVRTREELAAECGYESYEQMQYDSYARDYTPEEADDYIADIMEYIVPVYEEMMYDSNGGDIMDAAISRELLYDCVWSAKRDIGGEVENAFDFMTENELCDAEVSTVKKPGAYTTYISGYNEPFVYIGATGYADDIFTLAHEFGHFTDNYKNGYCFETLDVAECYSLGMEYLVLERLNAVLEDEDVDDLREYKIFDTLVTYVQQASFAEFENRVYDLGADNLTPEILNRISLETAEEFGYLVPGDEEYYALSWMDITHFIEYPFYVVSYTVSNDIALQIYEAELKGDGVKLYNKMVKRDNAYLMDFIKECGFESPFKEGRVQRAAEFIQSLC